MGARKMEVFLVISALDRISGEEVKLVNIKEDDLGGEMIQENQT